MLVLDVDGILTDTRIWFDGNEWRRFYSIRDGVGIKLLQAAGYKTAIITGSKAEDVRARAKSLAIDFFYEGALDKMPSFEELIKTSGIKPEEIAYMGDDVYDLPIFEKVEFCATVPEAVTAVTEKANYVTQCQGGMGAVREVCDQILASGFFAQTRSS